MKIAAFDLGTSTGWATYNTDCKPIKNSGFWNFKHKGDQSANLCFWKLAQNLNDLGEAHGGFDIVYYEAVTFASTVKQSQKWGGFKAILTAWCERNEIAYDGINVKTLKLHATGKGGASKDDMIFAAELLGFDPANDDEADAIHILHYGLEQNGLS